MYSLSKSQIRLMEIGQMALGNFHDIYRDLNNLSYMFEKDTSDKGQRAKRLVLSIKKNMDIASNLNRFDEHITDKISFSSLGERLEKFYKSHNSLAKDKAFGYKTIITTEFVNDFEFERPLAPILQILLNLIYNAENHSQGSNVRVVFKDNTITIADDGVGISEDVQERMYDMGFTTNLEKRELAGCGLYSVKVLCDKFGIGLTFKNGGLLKGANFTLSF